MCECSSVQSERIINNSGNIAVQVVRRADLIDLFFFEYRKEIHGFSFCLKSFRITITQQVVTNCQLPGIGFVNGSKMFSGIDSFFAVNVHFIIFILYNTFINTLGNQCIIAVTDNQFCFSKATVGSNVPPISCFTGTQIPFNLFVVVVAFLVLVQPIVRQKNKLQVAAHKIVKCRIG